MDIARIAALLEPFLDRPLTPAQLKQISIYIDLLLRWNTRINLTAVRNPEEIVTRHFGESLFMARHLFPTERRAPSPISSLPRPPLSHGSPTTRVIDIGSGAGFPGLPVKIWAPDIHSVLIESNHKKATFLREVARALTLTNVDVLAERVEIVSARLGPEFPPADIVTFRAVEKFDQILPLATTFLSTQSRLAILISRPQLPKLATLLPALNCQLIPIPKSHSRVLAICVLQESGKP